MSGFKRKINLLNQEQARSLAARLQEVEQDYQAACARLRQRAAEDLTPLAEARRLPQAETVEPAPLQPLPAQAPIAAPLRAPRPTSHRADQRPPARARLHPARPQLALDEAAPLPELLAENYTWQQALIQSAWLMLGEIENSRYSVATDLNGRSLELLFDVDVWSDGELGQLEALARQCLHDLQQAPLPAEWLSELDARLQTILAGLPQVVDCARLALLSSQLRYELAEQIARRLQANGYRLEAGGYAQEDLRQPYQLHLSSQAAQVWIQIEPDPESLYFNQAHLLSEPAGGGLPGASRLNLQAVLGGSGIESWETPAAPAAQPQPVPGLQARHARY